MKIFLSNLKDYAVQITFRSRRQNFDFILTTYVYLGYEKYVISIHKALLNYILRIDEK
jgi:hypothetical protein